MISKFSILIFFILIRFFLLYDGNLERQPLIMVDNWNLEDVHSEEPAFILKDDSTKVVYDVILLKDEYGVPYAYSSHILTPVCDDSLCALMNIKVYWNLLGNYIGYDTIAGDPLTKNDHLPFLTEDYQKLHQLLSDDNSIIKRKEKHELFDSEQKRVSEVVDAVTGATAKEISEAVVDGALYSCYTLYHIVYGPLSKSILADMESRYTPSLQEHFLKSNYSDYQLYVLKRLTENDFIEQQGRILELIHQAIPLNRLYIMKKMPESMWMDEKIQLAISGFFGDLDGNSMTYFLRKMGSVGRINPQIILDLIQHMEMLSQNQLKMLIHIFEQNNMTPEITDSVKKILGRDQMTFGFLLEDYLDELEKQKTIEN